MARPEVVDEGVRPMEGPKADPAKDCIPEETFHMDHNDYDRVLALRRKRISRKMRAYYESLK